MLRYSPFIMVMIARSGREGEQKKQSKKESENEREGRAQSNSHSNPVL